MALNPFANEIGGKLLGDEFIERLRAEASVAGSLAVDPLKEFCEIQTKRTPNIPFPTAGGKIAWDTLLELRGWKVQRNKITKHIRILDDRNVRRAWGDGKMLLELYRYLLRLHSKQYHSEVVPDLGIVFCGGGAKGAYQIGVWRRLRELGLEARINGVSGASVGALNSLLFAQGDLDLAEKIWLGIDEDDMLQLNSNLSKMIELITSDNVQEIKNILRKIIIEGGSFALWTFADVLADCGLIPRMGFLKKLLVDNVKNVLVESTFVGVDVGMIAPIILSEGICKRNFLEDIINQSISEDTIMASKKRIFTALTMRSLSKPPENKENPQNIFGQVDYRNWDGLTFSEIKSYVFASSAFPFVYKSMKIDGDTFIDGGAVDNQPVYPLAEAGFSAVIVVHLTPPEKIEKKRKIQKRIDTIAENVRVFHVWPSKSIGETFEISPELTRERMALGYADACAQLKGLTGPTSTRN